MARLGLAWHGVARQGRARQGEGQQSTHEEDNMTEHITEPEEAEVSPYPLDVTTLERGQDLTEAECAKIIGCKPDDKRWPFAMMMLVGWIMHESEAAGRPLSACQRKGGIHINTDAEAATYHVRNAAKHEDGIKRNFRHLCKTVRADDLNDIQRMEHEQNVKLLALKVAALKGANKIKRDEVATLR
jgi:hypothetical protein